MNKERENKGNWQSGDPAQRMLLVLAAVSALTLVFDGWLYWTGRQWQILGVGGATLLALLLTPVAWRLVRKGKRNAAGALTLGAIAVVFVANELLLSGGTPGFVLGGVAAMVLASLIFWPGRVAIWLPAGILLAASLLLLGRVAPLERVPLAASAAQNVAAPVILILLGGGLLWALLRSFRIGTIRTRLLASYLLMALVPVVLVGGTALAQGYSSSRSRVEAELELAATLKDRSITLWLEQLQNDLANVLVGQEIQMRTVMLLETENPSADLLRSSELQDRFDEVLTQSDRFTELFMLDKFGRVLVATDPTQVGVGYNNEIFYQRGRRGPYIQPPFYTPEQEHRLITIVRPVLNFDKQVVGVLGARANLDVLNTIMNDPTNLGAGSETYLVSRNKRILTQPASGAVLGTLVVNAATQEALEFERGGTGVYPNYEGKQVVGVYHWVPTLQVVLMAEQDQAVAFRPLVATMAIAGGVMLASFLLAVVVAVTVTRTIANPLTDLVETAGEIAAGNLALSAPVEREDETGELARAFNTMTGRLRELIGSLEQRVAERTRDLEQRSAYLEAAAAVGSAASSILDAGQLMEQAVELIRERFDLYYVGLFTLDENEEWALLRAGTGTAGQAMLARQHRIKVGAGMVGWACARGESRVALEAGADAVRLATSELPETRSEAAIPLISRGRVLGALTVQDRRPEAFNRDTIAVLQTMADQVAVALDNASLFSQSQTALDAAQRAYGELTGQAWAELLRGKQVRGVQSSERGVSLLDAPVRNGNGNGHETYGVPILVRGNQIGVLETHRARGEWTADEMALLNTIADQLGLALENARLYEESQRRAARERLVREITERVRTAGDIDAIAQITAEELGKAIGARQSFVVLSPAEQKSEAGR